MTQRDRSRLYPNYLQRLSKLDLDDRLEVHRAFREQVEHVHPSLWAATIPLAISASFLPTVVQDGLTRGGGFLNRPLTVFASRILFFYGILIAERDSDGTWEPKAQAQIQRLVAMHARLGTPFGSADFDRDHIAVIGSMFTGFLQVARYSGRSPSPQEEEVACAWLASLAEAVGVKGFPRRASEVKLFMADYESEQFAINNKEASRRLLDGALAGLACLVPAPGLRPFVARALNVLYFTAVSDAFVAGFGASRPPRFQHFLARGVLLGLQNLGCCWHRLSPYRRKPFDFNALASWMERQAERG